MAAKVEAYAAALASHFARLERGHPLLGHTNENDTRRLFEISAIFIRNIIFTLSPFEVFPEKITELSRCLKRRYVTVDIQAVYTSVGQ